MLVKLGGRKLFNSYGNCTMGDDVEEHASRWQELLSKHATNLLTNEEDLYDRVLEILRTETEDERTEDKDITTMRDVLDYVERKTIYKKQLAQQKLVMREQTRKSSMNGLMRGAYNPCGGGQCGHDHRGQASHSAATGQPDFESIVALTLAALNQRKGGTKPRGRPADKKVNADGTVRCWIEPECFE